MTNQTNLSFGIKTAPQGAATYEAILRIWQEADAIPEIKHAWLWDHMLPPSVLHIAQSCWRRANYEPSTWDTTSTNVAAAAKFNCDLPLILDDTKTNRNQRGAIAEIVYQLISGKTRGRANIKGNQRLRPTWRLIVLTTGEEPIGDLVKSEGASARVLSFWGTPFGETSDQTKALLKSTIDALSFHYGHAGPAVVQWLCEHRDQWDKIKKLYNMESQRVLNEIATPAAARLAEVVALLECAAWVAKQAGCFPSMDRPLHDYPEIREAMKRALTLASTSSDQAYEAWEYAMSEAMSKPRSWIPWGKEPKEDRDPPGGWLGYYQVETTDDSGDTVPGERAWFPQQLFKVLSSGGFTPKAIYRAWKDLGVLVKPERSRYTSQVRPGFDRTKMRLIRVSDEYPGHEMDDVDDGED